MSAVRMTMEDKLEHLLADGYAHTRSEVLRALGDPLMEYNALAAIVHRLRKKLLTDSRGIVCIGLPTQENKVESHYQIIKVNPAAFRK